MRRGLCRSVVDVAVKLAGDHSRSGTGPSAEVHLELASGEIRKAYVFVSGLGFSQLLFAWAAEDMKSRNWLGAHRRMFAFYGGVTHITVPDCLKVHVLGCVS